MWGAAGTASAPEHGGGRAANAHLTRSVVRVHAPSATRMPPHSTGCACSTDTVAPGRTPGSCHMLGAPACRSNCVRQGCVVTRGARAMTRTGEVLREQQGELAPGMGAPQQPQQQRQARAGERGAHHLGVEAGGVDAQAGVAGAATAAKGSRGSAAVQRKRRGGGRDQQRPAPLRVVREQHALRQRAQRHAHRPARLRRKERAQAQRGALEVHVAHAAVAAAAQLLCRCDAPCVRQRAPAG